VAMASESGNFYSGSFMFYLSSLDKNKNILVYRHCAFENKSSEEIKKMLDDNNIYYVVFVRNGVSSENFYKFKGFINLEKVFDGIEIYRVADFESKPIKNCNFICLTKETICV
jgi:predicted CoA-binding protein